MLPFAIDRELRITVELADDIDIRSPDGDVSTYARCVAQALRTNGYAVAAVRGDVRSDIPIGAGLSSSAALEAGIALALTGGARVSPSVLQEAGQLATGVPCGVMDQTAVLESKAGHALALDCATGAFEHVALPLEVGFVVIDTGTRRDLADGRYAQRRAEVEAGEPKRVRHASSEQRRVYDAVDALRAGDVAALGALVSDSHTSLRDDFEVSAPPLDRAVQAVCEHPACHGARLVGAGFAGCVLAVVEAERADDVVAFVRKRLTQADAYEVQSVAGASEVRLRAGP